MLKDKKIDIIGYIEDKNELGETTQLETVIAPNIWAYYRHSTAKEKETFKIIETKVDVVFIVNYRKDITTSNKIKYRGQIYEISQIDDFEGYKEDLKIYAYRITN